MEQEMPFDEKTLNAELTLYRAARLYLYPDEKTAPRKDSFTKVGIEICGHQLFIRAADTPSFMTSEQEAALVRQVLQASFRQSKITSA
jgi:hypothetical protein